MKLWKNKTPCRGLFFSGAEAAQAQLLAGARFDVAVAALTDDDRSYLCLFYPVAVFLKRLSRPLGLDIFALIVLLIIFGL